MFGNSTPKDVGGPLGSYSTARIMAGGKRAPGGASSRKPLGDAYGAEVDDEVLLILPELLGEPSANRAHAPKKQEDSANRKIFSALKKKQDEERSNMFWKLWLYTFLPNEQPRKGWDLTILVLVLFTSWKVPYMCAFVPGDPDPAELPKMQVIDWTVDVMFYLDMILNFWTGYEEGQLLVKEKGQIAMNYLTGFFWVDVVATVEWDLLILAFADDDAIDSHFQYKLRVVRTLKILRLARWGRLIVRLTEHLRTHTAYVAFAKFFVYVFYCAHFLACYFAMLSTIFTSCTNFDEEATLPQCSRADNCSWGIDDFKGTCVRSSWRTYYSQAGEYVIHMSPIQQYVQSLYWAMTTMTTIGYGDRGPQNEVEVVFTIIAELIGLSIFAMLIQQINNLTTVLSEEDEKMNEMKNDLVKVMKYNNIEKYKNAPRKNGLIQQVVEFVNFKGNSQSGHDITTSPHFRSLPTSMREEILESTYGPKLREVRIFGRSGVEAEEMRQVKGYFEDTDVDGGGSLDQSEIGQLICALGVEDLTKDQLDEAMRCMDEDGSGSVECDEFEMWWYLEKYGRVRMPPCRDMLLKTMAQCMASLPVSKGATIVPHVIEDRGTAFYGEAMYIILTGRAVIQRKDSAKRNAPRINLCQVHHTDPDNIVGLQAVLGEREYARYASSNELVEVLCGDDVYAECLYIQRADFRDCLIEEWPEAMPLLQRHAIKLQEELHHQALICLIVDKNEELDVLRMGRSVADITPDPEYFAAVPADPGRLERSRQKRVELDGMDIPQLMRTARRIGVDPRRLQAYDWTDGLDPCRTVAPALPPAVGNQKSESEAKIDSIEAQVGHLGQRMGRMEELLQTLVDQSGSSSSPPPSSSQRRPKHRQQQSEKQPKQSQLLPARPSLLQTPSNVSAPSPTKLILRT